METTTHILNGTINQIINTDDPTLTAIIAGASLAVAVITFIGIVWTSKLTRKSNQELKRSNELLEKELKNRLRPQFEFIKTQSSLQSNTGNWKVRLYYTIKNSGTVTARKIIRRSIESRNTEINNIVKEWDSIKNTTYDVGTIPQNESVDLFEDIPWDADKQTTNWIIWLEYEYFDIKEKCVIVFPNFGGGQQPVPHRWFIHDDVVEAEKRRDDERAGNISVPF